MDKIGPDIILLTREGEFVQLPANRSYSIGMEAEFDSPWRRRFPLLFSMAVAAALMMFAVFYSIQPALTAPSAYLAVDINPSVVFSLDKNAVVLEATALNPDGESLLEIVNAKGSDVFDVLKNLFEAAYANHYLTAGKENIIIISLAAPDGFGITEEDLHIQVSGQLSQMELNTYLKITVSGLDKIETSKDMSIPLNALVLAEEMEKMMKQEEGRSLLEGTSPLPVKEFLQIIDPSDIFTRDELIVGKGRKDSMENLPGPEEDGEPAGGKDDGGKPVDIPAPVSPEPEVPTDPKDRGTTAP